MSSKKPISSNTSLLDLYSQIDSLLQRPSRNNADKRVLVFDPIYQYHGES